MTLGRAISRQSTAPAGSEPAPARGPPSRVSVAPPIDRQLTSSRSRTPSSSRAEKVTSARAPSIQDEIDFKSTSAVGFFATSLVIRRRAPDVRVREAISTGPRTSSQPPTARRVGFAVGVKCRGGHAAQSSWRHKTDSFRSSLGPQMNLGLGDRRRPVAERNALDADDHRVVDRAGHEQPDAFLEHLLVPLIDERLLSTLAERVEALLTTNPVEAPGASVDLDAAFDVRESELAVDVVPDALGPFDCLLLLVDSVYVRLPDERDHCDPPVVESVPSTACTRFGPEVQPALKVRSISTRRRRRVRR